MRKAVLLTTLLSGGAAADTTPPTVTITCTQATLSAAATLNFTFTWSEAVTGFVVGDITVGGGSASNFAGSGASYTCDIVPSGVYLTVDIAGGVCQDAAGNANTAATQFTFTSLRFVTSWYDAADLSTLFTDSAGSTPVANDGDVIGKWADKTANGNNLLQAGASNTKPQYKVNIQNGKAVVRFDGASSTQYLQSAAYALGTKCYIIMCLAQTGWETNRLTFAEVTAGKEMQLYCKTATPRRTMWETADGPTTTGLDIGTFHILELYFDGANSYLRVDNGTDATGNPGSHAMDGLTLNATRVGSSGNVQKHDFGEILTFGNFTPSASDRTAMRNYLNSRWATF